MEGRRSLSRLAEEYLDLPAISAILHILRIHWQLSTVVYTLKIKTRERGFISSAFVQRRLHIDAVFLSIDNRTTGRGGLCLYRMLQGEIVSNLDISTRLLRVRDLQFDFFGHLTTLGNSLSEDQLQPILVAFGWCPNQYVMCRATFGMELAAFCAHYHRPIQRRHEQCSRRECVAYHILDEATCTRHTQQGCKCAFLEAPTYLTWKLIQGGSFPLLKVTAPAAGSKATVEITQATEDSHFVAISHVWSHGLGNALENSLPSCQLLRIQQLASDLAGRETLFWLDTLCIPRFPLHARRRGIEAIRDVYRQASKMLVLDEELQASQIRGRSFLEIIMSINLSGWMRRLWTLHESIRALAIHFQFKDGTISRELVLNHGSSIIKSMHIAGMTANYRRVLFRATCNLFSTARINAEPDGAVRLACLWRLLRWRHTSWPEDETVCMANVLGLEREVVDCELLRSPSGVRMQMFLRKFNLYPANLLFLDVPRLDRPGYRWAPRSWLHDHDMVREQLDFGYDRISTGARCEKGLLCSLRSISLHGVYSFGEAKSCVIVIVNGSALSLTGVQLCEWIGTDRRFWDAAGHKILLQPWDDVHSLSLGDCCRGILVKHDRDVVPQSMDSVGYGQFLCPVLITRQMCEQSASISGLNEGSSAWCVG